MIFFVDTFFILFMLVIIIYSICHSNSEKLQNHLSFPIVFRNIVTTKWFLPIVTILIIATRFILFPEIPVGINQDGAMAAVDANALATYKTDRFGTFMPAHLYAWGNSQMSSLLSYLIAPLIKLFGLGSLSLRLPQMVISLLGIVSVFIMFCYMYGKRAGYLAAIMVAINPWHFIQSRWGIDCNLFPHLFIVGFSLLVLFIYSEKKRFLYISMFFFGISMFSYGVSFFFIPFFLIFACIVLFANHQISIKDIIICLLIYFLISWPEYLVMIVNFLKCDTIALPFITIQYFDQSVRSNDILFFAPDFITQFIKNIIATAKVIFLQKKDLPLNDIAGFGSMYLFSFPLIAWGLYVSIKKIINNDKCRNKKEKIAYLLFLGYWLFSMFLCLIINNVNVNRANIVFYSQIILIIVGILDLYRRFHSSILPALFMYGISFVLLLGTYFTSYQEELTFSTFPDFGKALTYAKNVECDYYVITPDVHHEGATAVSEILTEYYFSLDAHYTQGLANQAMGKNIPYSKRFVYKNLEENQKADPSKCYIFRIWKSNDVDETSFFSSELFSISEFDNYGVAVPKSK